MIPATPSLQTLETLLQAVDDKTFVEISASLLKHRAEIVHKPSPQFQPEDGGAPYVLTPFQEKYFQRPDLFVQECLHWQSGVSPTAYQLEICEAFPHKKRCAVRGPHGLGKTALASWIVLWFALTRDGYDWKIVTTASAYRQLVKYLWPEIHKWVRKIRWDVIGTLPWREGHELLSVSLRLNTGSAFAVASNKPDLIEGAHAKHMLYVYDEAKAIPDKTWDAIEGAFANVGAGTGDEGLALAISTPGDINGRFYDINRKKAGLEDWWVRFVTKAECIAAGRMSADWAEQKKRLWGETSAVYQNRVEGQFAAQDEHAIVPLAWIELANQRWEAWKEKGFPGTHVITSADIAEGGGNKTVFANLMQIGGADCFRAVKDFEEFTHAQEKKTATMATAGRLAGKKRAEPKLRLIVDAIGIGAGVAHRLNELQLACTAFKGGEKTSRVDFTRQFTFNDKNSAAWYLVREMLNPDYQFPMALPPSDDLVRDLTTRHYSIRSDGVVIVEGKKEMRKRLKLEEPEAEMDSPDYGDALAMALFAIMTPQAGGANPPSKSEEQRREGYIRRGVKI